MDSTVSTIGTKKTLQISAGECRESPEEVMIYEDTHLCVIAGEKSCAAYVIHVQDATCLLDVTVEQGAQLQVNVLVDSGTVKQQGHVWQDATLIWKNETCGAHASQEVRSFIEGVNGESSIYWIFRAHNKDQLHLSAHNIFQNAQGKGEIVMKGVAEHEARVTCDGLIAIGKGGKGTDTYLTQDVLMLDRTAKVDAIPGLEIKTNDVKASHSASVRHVSPEEIFYFASRGVEESEARKMYIEGFLTNLEK